MKFDNKENECATLVDGRKVWLSRSVAVVNMIIAEVDDRIYVLMVKRGPGCPDEIGKWVMPCGYLDWNETLAECGIRETYEETGLNLNEFGNHKIGYLVRDDYNDGQPWSINSMPTSNKQNVSCYFIKRFMFNSKNDIPTIDSSKLNPQETETCAWLAYDGIHAIWANGGIGFNHFGIIQRYLNK